MNMSYNAFSSPLNTNHPGHTHSCDSSTPNLGPLHGHHLPRGSPITPAFHPSAKTAVAGAAAAPPSYHIPHPSSYAALSSMSHDPLEATIPPTSLDISSKAILNTVVLQQQKRILELEKELQHSRLELSRIHHNLRVDTTTPRSPTACPKPSPAVPVPTPAAPAPAPSAAAPEVAEPPVEAEEAPRGLAVVAASPAVAGGMIKKKKKSKKAKPEPEPGTTRYWLQSEHDMFLKGCQMYGNKNYIAISQLVKTRTPKQVRTHAQKYEKKIAREAIRKGMMTTPSLYVSHLSSANSPSLDSDDTMEYLGPIVPTSGSPGPALAPFEHLKREDDGLEVPGVGEEFDVLEGSLDDVYDSEDDDASPLSNQELSCDLGDDFDF